MQSSSNIENRNHETFSSNTSSDLPSQSEPLGSLPNLRPELTFVSQQDEEDRYDHSAEESIPILENNTPIANWSGLDLYTDGRIDDGFQVPLL